LSPIFLRNTGPKKAKTERSLSQTFGFRRVESKRELAAAATLGAAAIAATAVASLIAVGFGSSPASAGGAMVRAIVLPVSGLTPADHFLVLFQILVCHDAFGSWCVPSKPIRLRNVWLNSGY